MELTDKQQRFVDEYCIDCNGTQAAVRAGYSAASAYSIASENLRKPEIRTAIDERLSLLAMSADEAVKHISDIAATRLNQYLKVVERKRGTEVPQPLQEAIDASAASLLFEEQFTARSAVLLGLIEDDLEDHWAAFKAKQQRAQLVILRWQMQLEADPAAFRMVAGEPEIYEAVEVDMIALAQADTTGRIKTLSFGEYGPKVEMYAADAALRDILKLNGRFVERTDISSGGKAITATVEIVAAGPPIATNEQHDDV